MSHAICQGICKNGKPCSHKAKIEGFCGKHIKIYKKTYQDPPIAEEREEGECPICYDKLSKPLTCPNGHKVCEDHYLKYITATYETSNLPKGRCFICRETLSTSCFSQGFIKQLPDVIVNAQLKKAKQLRPPPTGQPVTLRFQTVLIEMLQFINVHD